MSKVNSQKSIVKIAGMLMPIFLLISGPQSTSGQTLNLVPAVFSISPKAITAEVLSDYGFETVKLFASIYRVEVSSKTFSMMQKDSRFAYVEPDTEVFAAVVIPSDPFFTTDPGLGDKQWYLAKTHVPDAWEFTRGSTAVTIAIIDTGIHASHVELNDGRIIEGYNVITRQTIPANSDSDDNGHGTAVAGVIGATSNNIRGMAGINWNIKIMPIKALAADGTGDLSAVAAGMVWAADHGANIINLSLGGPGYGADMTMSNAISYAFSRGVLIVSAAGNDLSDQGLNLDQSPVYPVCGDNGQNMILGVAATDINDQKTSFSNFGASCIDISSPGKKIVTTGFLPSNPVNNVLIYGSGTSLATPIVSGIAALIKAQNNNLSNTDIRNIIMKTADNIYPLNQTSCFGGSCNGFLGAGRINALAAVSPKPITEGALIRELGTGNIYLITSGMKRLVSNLVFTQRGFVADNVVDEINLQLASFPSGNALPPLDATLIKGENDPTVFVIDQGLKRPLTYLVFVSRNYSFANVKTLPDAEVALYQAADWYWPPDGTLVLIKGDPLVYVMDQQVARPITYFVFTQRNLSFAKVIAVTMDEFSHVPRPADPSWEPPLDGTLVKSFDDPGIYVVELGTKRLLSYQVFISRGYSFKNVKTLPQAEIDVIAPGLPIL